MTSQHEASRTVLDFLRRANSLIPVANFSLSIIITKEIQMKNSINIRDNSH